MSKSGVLGRIPLTAWIGVALVLIPLTSLGVWAGWYFTRVWLPLDIPISLARGHFRAEFDINVESLYAMQLELKADRTRLSDAVTLAAVAWSVSKESRILARGTGGLRTRSIGGSDLFGAFQGGKGHDVVDLDVPEDQSRLNVYEPWLLIYEDGGKYFSTTDLGAVFLLALLLCGPIGASMTILATVHWRQEKVAEFWRTHPMTQPGPAPERFLSVSGRTIDVSRRARSPVQRPFSRLSQHSPILFLTFMIVWIFWASITPLVLHGLRVHLLRPGVVAQRSPGIQPLLVRVVRDGHSAKLYVGPELVAWNDLGAVLRKELARRPLDWPVYVEGDPDLEWRQVAEAIDAIDGEQAEVVLLPHAAKSQ